MKKKLFLFLILLITALAWNFDRLLGLAVKPVLEGKLTSLFGMPVEFGSLAVNPFTGRVGASEVRFMNQEAFSPGPHLDIEEMEFDIDFLRFRRHHVLIPHLRLKKFLYFIESIPYGKGDSISNVGTWVRHIKKKPGGGSDSEDWKVTIPEILIEDGAFVFKKAGPKKKKFIFRNLNGFLKGFEWPTAEPAYLAQEVLLDGTFGEEEAPMRLRGKANFATSRVSFDVEGEIENGAVEKHPFVWQGLPIKVTGGGFFLKTKMVCVTRQLEVDSVLTLKSLQFVPKQNPSALIWGLPLMGSMGFLQSEKTIRLEVPVKGDIADPQFGFAGAFQKAFQESLKRYTNAGVDLLRAVPVKTGEIVVAAPTRMIGEIEKISSTLVRNIPSIPSLVPASSAAEEEKGVKSK